LSSNASGTGAGKVKGRVRIRGYEDASPPPRSKNQPVLRKLGVAAGGAVTAVVAYFCWQGYLETRVNTPFDSEKVRKIVCYV
jgi:hypothetical protein